MTEADWRNGSDPDLMLDHLQSRVSDRKLRLFAVACARRAWRLFTEWELSENVLLGERFADGDVSPESVEVVRSQLWGERGNEFALGCEQHRQRGT